MRGKSAKDQEENTVTVVLEELCGAFRRVGV